MNAFSLILQAEGRGFAYKCCIDKDGHLSLMKLTPTMPQLGDSV